MTNHEGWRSVIADTFEVMDLRSYGMKGLRLPTLESLTPNKEQEIAHPPSEPKAILELNK